MTGVALGVMLGCSDLSNDIEYGHEVDGDRHRTGPLKNGKKHGAWTTVENGEIVEVQYWRDGVEHGPHRSWTYDLYSDYMHVNGSFHGRYRIFYSYDPPQIAEIGWYKKDRRTGTVCGWLPDGTLEYIHFYRYHRYRLTPVVKAEYPVGECPITFAEPRHLDPDYLNFD